MTVLTPYDNSEFLTLTATTPYVAVQITQPNSIQPPLADELFRAFDKHAKQCEDLSSEYRQVRFDLSESPGVAGLFNFDRLPVGYLLEHGQLKETSEDWPQDLEVKFKGWEGIVRGKA